MCRCLAGALVLLVVVLGVGLAVEETPRRDVPTAPKARKEAIGHWLREMEGHVAKLGDQDRRDIMPALCDVYWRVDDISPLARLISAIQDPKRRADASFILCFTLAQTGRVEAATRFAESLSGDPTVDPDTRERVQSPRAGRFSRSSACNLRGTNLPAPRRPSGGSTTRRRLPQPGAIWRRVRRRPVGMTTPWQALPRLSPPPGITRKPRTIPGNSSPNVCRRRHDPPQTPPPGEFIEGLRRVCALFGDVDVKLDDLAEAEKRAESMEGPLNKAAAWREIAWAYYRNGDIARCRQAMQKSLDIAEAVPAPWLTKERSRTSPWPISAWSWAKPHRPGG